MTDLWEFLAGAGTVLVARLVEALAKPLSGAWEAFVRRRQGRSQALAELYGDLYERFTDLSQDLYDWRRVREDPEALADVARSAPTDTELRARWGALSLHVQRLGPRLPKGEGRLLDTLLDRIGSGFLPGHPHAPYDEELWFAEHEALKRRVRKYLRQAGKA